MNASLAVRHCSLTSGLAGAWRGGEAAKACRQREQRVLAPGGSGTVPGGPGGRAAPVQVPSSATDVCGHLAKAVPCARARNQTSGAGTVLLLSCCGISEAARGRFRGNTAKSQVRSIQLGCLLEWVCPFCWCTVVVVNAASLSGDSLRAGAAGRGAADPQTEWDGAGSACPAPHTILWAGHSAPVWRHLFISASLSINLRF